MPQPFQLVTERLLLRPWREEDLAPFAEMNADPRVRQYFAGTLTREESDREAGYICDEFARNGYTFFAAEDRATGEFHGFIGLAQLNIDIPGVPPRAVEIGWRLKHASWNRGLATEGARAALTHALHTLRLPTVYAYTAVQNQPSRNVMEKLGLTYQPSLDFDHPRVPEGNPIRRHVIYSISNPQQHT
jgi:RimJ/RimL family protein N-acetyltransferase